MPIPQKNVAARTAWIDRPVKQRPPRNRKSELPWSVPSRGERLPSRTTPENGDIVVRAETRRDALVYVLHRAPGADQDLFRNLDDAITQAVTLAKQEDVRAWLTDEGYDFVLLEDFRIVQFS